MATCPLTTIELEDVLATLNRLYPDVPQWRTEPTPAGERGVILCGPAGCRVLIETAWNAPERLRISGLFPASPAGYPYPPRAQITPAITVARTRGPRALATAILHRLLPIYQPRLQAAQARECAHCDAVARQEAIAARLCHVAEAGTCVHCWHKPRSIRRLGAGHSDTGGRCHPDPPWSVSAHGRCSPDRPPPYSP
jgi:hypothetical protein